MTITPRDLVARILEQTSNPAAPIVVNICDDTLNIPGCMAFTVDQTDVRDGVLTLNCWVDVARAIREQVKDHNENGLNMADIVERLDRTLTTCSSLFDRAEEQHERDLLNDLAEAIVGLGSTPSVTVPDRIDEAQQESMWNEVRDALDDGRCVVDSSGRRWSMGNCPSGSVYWYCHYSSIPQTVYATLGWAVADEIAVQVCTGEDGDDYIPDLEWSDALTKCALPESLDDAVALYCERVEAIINDCIRRGLIPSA